MATILLAIYLLITGITGIFPRLSNDTVSLIKYACAILAGILFLVGK